MHIFNIHTNALSFIMVFIATPVGIIPEIRGTMAHLPEIIPTENILIPVPVMTTAQCQEDTGMS